MPSVKQAAPPVRSRRFPSAIYFEKDAVARKALEHCVRIPHASYEKLDVGRMYGENVFVLADERLFADYLKQLRAPNIRVIAISDERFRDPRLDGTVYAYLPTNVPPRLLERMFDNAIDHIHLVQTRREANDKLASAKAEIYELNHIGAALSAEHDARALMELILTKCREITHADAGSIYLVEEIEEIRGKGRELRRPKRLLRFKLAQNDTVQVPFREVVLPVSERSIAGYVAEHGSVLMIEDAYQLENWVPYSINKQFDIDSGYRTKSILAVAMMDQKNEVVGVVQLINAKRNWRAKLNTPEAMRDEVVPFSTRHMEIVSSLASQAAVAYENSRLYESIQRLFEGFVKASIGAIEQRDPATSGHSFRVQNLTVAMAEAINRDQGHFREVHFSRAEMREIRYSSLLHDFGKVGVREELLVKARKLYPAQLEQIRSRFECARWSLEKESMERRLRCLEELGAEAYRAKSAEIEGELEAKLKALEKALEFIESANEPSVLPEGSFERLNEIAALRYRGQDEQMHPLLTPEEVQVLSIRKGSLDTHEREEVESHVELSYNFLKQIPWTREIRNVPEIARGHHEKLNGRGYPNGLASRDISLQTRLMTVADVFDALAAADRPYKESVSVEKALEILGQMAEAGEIDPHVYELFVRERVYERWKSECPEY